MPSALLGKSGASCFVAHHTQPPRDITEMAIPSIVRLCAASCLSRDTAAQSRGGSSFSRQS